MPQLSAETKVRFVIGMHASGMSNGHIVQVLGISKSTVARWIKRNDEQLFCTRQEESARLMPDSIELSVGWFWPKDFPVLQIS